jgi:hypothetical protein
VVVGALRAVLAGANGPTSIAKWAKLKAEFLRAVLNLPNGVPRKDVSRRVLALLQPAAFRACFTTWLTTLRQATADQTGIAQPIFAVDGKTARRSHDHSKGLGALHAVSLGASEFWLSLRQVACAEKSNENAAKPVAFSEKCPFSRCFLPQTIDRSEFCSSVGTFRRQTAHVSVTGDSNRGWFPNLSPDRVAWA